MRSYVLRWFSICTWACGLHGGQNLASDVSSTSLMPLMKLRDFEGAPAAWGKAVVKFTLCHALLTTLFCLLQHGAKWSEVQLPPINNHILWLYYIATQCLGTFENSGNFLHILLVSPSNRKNSMEWMPLWKAPHSAPINYMICTTIKSKLYQTYFQSHIILFFLIPTQIE